MNTKRLYISTTLKTTAELSRALEKALHISAEETEGTMVLNRIDYEGDVPNTSPVLLDIDIWFNTIEASIEFMSQLMKEISVDAILRYRTELT